MFANSIRLFRLFGFEVKLDASWLLLAVLIAWSLAVGYFPAVSPGLDTVTYWSMGIVGLFGLAFSIVVHELAHSLVARRFDMPIKGITLFVFGGVAEMRQEPTSPKGEFLMAIAGPLMSVAVAFGFGALAWAFGGAAVSGAAGDGAPRIDAPPFVLVLSYLSFINLLLAGFNLIPAFPLDGGRMLRAALWAWKGDILWATRIAAAAGSAFAFALMALGLFSVISGNLDRGITHGIWFLRTISLPRGSGPSSTRQANSKLKNVRASIQRSRYQILTDRSRRELHTRPPSERISTALPSIPSVARAAVSWRVSVGNGASRRHVSEVPHPGITVRAVIRTCGNQARHRPERRSAQRFENAAGGGGQAVGRRRRRCRRLSCATVATTMERAGPGADACPDVADDSRQSRREAPIAPPAPRPPPPRRRWEL